MFRVRQIRPFRATASALVAVFALAMGTALAADAHTTKPFTGVKVQAGTAIHETRDGRMMLTLSDDFKVPDAPDPHWQVVDSKGNVYLLQRLMVKSDKLNRTIVLPTYIKDVAKVQIWCAFAEVLLGEAPFHSPVM
jgi:hypothetical protein